ncbi:hypothetical protein O59_002621 [Cellvibrio sp. BR]|nr:hypothetical protein O59_002621 [Cellvibrio sp. BR]
MIIASLFAQTHCAWFIGRGSCLLRPLNVNYFVFIRAQ